MSTWLIVSIDFVFHIACALTMFYIARARGIGWPFLWAFIGFLTGPLGLVVFLAVMGWQYMFQRGSEERTLKRSQQMVDQRTLTMQAYRDSMEIPGRDGYLDRLIYEDRPDEAREVAREQLRQAWEQGNTDREKLMRKYLAELGEG